MFDVLFLELHGWVGRRRRFVLGGALLLALLVLWRVSTLTVESNLENLLPADPGVVESLRFLRQSGFSDRVVLSLSLPQPDANPVRLMAATDRLAALLPGRWVTEAGSGMPEGDLADDWDRLLGLTPQMMTEKRVETLRDDLTDEAVAGRIGALYRRLLAPGSSMGRFMAADPLGLAGETLGELQGLTAAFGFRARPAGRHLLSEDERHALLLLRTPVAIPDGFGSRALMEHIDACLAASPDRLEARIVAGHRHTVSNEDAIRGDLRRVGVAAVAGFAVLLFGVFRDKRVGLVFFSPLVAVLFAVAVASLVFATLSHLLLGMGVVMAGISMDYAIHAYVAQRTGGTEGVRRIARPLIVGACTTAAVFFSFFFSTVPAYSQLAFFSLLSLFTSLATSLLLLPHGIRRMPAASALPDTGRVRTRAASRAAVAVWCGGLLVLGASASRVVFLRDIGQFDGSAEEVFDDLREFHRVWGGETQPAMLVVEGEHFETVWRTYERVSGQAAARLGEGKLLSLAPLWPSRETRERRLRHWRGFWAERGMAVRDAMDGAARSHGFAEDAFVPFLDWVEGAGPAQEGFPDSAFLRGIQDRFCVMHEDRVWAIAHFEDTPENLRRLTDLEGAADGASVQLVSRGALSRRISDGIAQEMGRLSVLAGGLILIPLFLLTRNLRRSLLALAPVATAVVAILGAFPLAGRPLTAVALVAGMIVVGLVIDYGVFIVFDEIGARPAASWAGRRTSPTLLAIHLSAGTTLVGAGALLLARHPVMFDIGYTLVAGVTTGYLCAVLVLPALCRLTAARRMPR